MPPSEERRVVKIVIDAPGVKKALDEIAGSMGAVTKNTGAMAKSMKTVNDGALAFLGGYSLRNLLSYSDEILNLKNKLLALTGSQLETNKTFNQLVSISRDTNSTLDSTGQAYFRISQALKDVGVSQGTLLETTKTIVNTFRLSGASAQEAANATIQLGQAFSLGVLRGQDLRSVMSQNVVLTRLLRKEFGTNLLKSAEKGLITVPKIMELLHKNMGDVNERAKLLGATFEQSLNKGLDALKIKIFEVGDSIGINGIFAKGINFAIKHMDLLVEVAGVLAFGTIPALTVAIYGFASSLGVANLATVAFTAPWLALIAVVKVFGIDFEEMIVSIESGFSVVKSAAYSLIATWKEVAAAMPFNAEDTKKRLLGEAAAAKQEAYFADLHAKALWVEYEAKKANQAIDEKRASKFKEDMEKMMAAFKSEKSAKELLADLNREFLNGSISVADYNEQILKTQRAMDWSKFKEGEIDLGKLNDALRKVDVFTLNRALKEGKITLEQFRNASNDIKLKNLNEDLDAGRISLEDYNSKLASVANNFSAQGAFRTGLQDYVNALGTTTQQVAGAIKNAFDNLEDVFMEFIKHGKFEFAKFTQAILDDLTRIILRATIIQPLATGILSAISTPAASSGGTGSGGHFTGPPAAKGAWFDRDIAQFAVGGVVNSPTLFGFGKGKTGLMGEAGPEAILPLKRGAGGELGVKASVTPVVVNVINQSGNEVKQSETTGPNGEKTIEVIITNKVREGIVTGRFDKAFNQSYGLNRRGG